MKTADETLRAAAKKGELTYCSIIPKAGKGGVVFLATYRGASEGHVGNAEDADPGAAIAKAIEAAKTAPGKLTKRKPSTDDEPDFG